MWAVRNTFNDQNESTLTHYGVKGMKWGVRKEYETKGTRKGKSDTGLNNPFKDITDRIDRLKNKKDEMIDTKYGPITVDHYDLEDLKRTKKTLDYINDEYDRGRYMPVDDARKAVDNYSKQSTWMSSEQQILATNHDGKGVNRLINCFECSMAYEMRMRGYDVQAKEMPGGYGYVEPLHAFAIKDGFELSLAVSTSDREALAKEVYSQMEKQCLEYGDGARGCLGIQYWEAAAGHSMQWEVKNGEFKIIDSQESGRNGYETFLHADTSKGISVYRLDNADVLPGVADFVESYEMNEEELIAYMEMQKKKAESKKSSDQKKAEKILLEDAKGIKTKDKQLWDEKSFTEKIKAMPKKVSTVIDQTKHTIASAVNSVKKSAKKAASSFSKKNKDDGRSFIEKLFNIEKKTKTETHTLSDNMR